jgi:hypothetical protein
VRDGKNEHRLCVNFERDYVRELLKDGLPYRDRSGLRRGPAWIKSRSFFQTLQNFVDSIDESIAPA